MFMFLCLDACVGFDFGLIFNVHLHNTYFFGEPTQFPDLHLLSDLAIFRSKKNMITRPCQHFSSFDPVNFHPERIVL
jgi:hypothetical protein